MRIKCLTYTPNMRIIQLEIIRGRRIRLLKKADLVQMLEQNGWYLKRNGANHDIYTNGVIDQPIPRHREIREGLAKKILKRAGI